MIITAIILVIITIIHTSINKYIVTTNKNDYNYTCYYYKIEITDN